MIEVEKKFLLSNEEEARLLEGAVFLKEASITDTYYDDDRFTLTLEDWWLRERNGRFELKMPLRVQGFERATDQYHELETDDEIREALGLQGAGDLADAIAEAGLVAFCSCRTRRRKYQKDGFSIDLDEVTYRDDPFRYAVAEIESMVASEAEIKDATDKILAFAEAHGLTTDKPILGKVGAYVKHARPAHYDALVKVGLFG